ncbi:hypothetical protein [Pseudomonas sp. CJQ_11]|uniref:hypothetical protein n=1 Tax=Pseudomonas sp. CJQ_11 TaxID=3367169 RepID=UPI00370C2841
MNYLICNKTLRSCPTPGMCSPYGGCKSEELKGIGHVDLGAFVDWVYNLKLERDQLKAENEELKQNVRYSDQIIETRNRLLKSIPPCPVHGDECVPHAMEWVASALAKERGQ